MTRSALLGAILGFVAAFALGGCETRRSETPNPYADTLTQALLLDQGEEFQGPAPKAFDSGPCILEQNNKWLQLGQAFYFRLMSLYSHDDVQYALVHVRGAAKTLRVNGVLHGGLFPITGLLQGDETLRGKTFTIEITLVATKGAGPVVSFPLSILDSPPDTDNTTISALSAKGEQRFPSGRAPGSVADGPHIENLQRPGLLAEREAVVSITTFYDRDGQKSLSDITAVVMSVPTSQEYKEFPVKVTGEHRLRINVTPRKTADKYKTQLVLLALKTKDRVGTYYPFTFATEGGCNWDNTGDLYNNCSMLFGDCNEGWCDQATQCCVEWLCDNTNEAQLGGPCGGGGLFDGGDSCFAGLYCNMATGCCEALSDGDSETEGCPTLNCTGIFSHCPTGFVCDAAANCCVEEGTLDGDAERESAEAEGEAEGEPTPLNCDETSCLDPNTGLTWQLAPEQLGWEAAKTYCQELSLGGQTDWRLPSISELRGLIRACPGTQNGGTCGVRDSCLVYQSCKNEGCTGCAVKGGPADGCYWPSGLGGPCGTYFSASQNSGPGNGAWTMDFAEASIAVTAEYVARYVRCLRGGEPSSPTLTRR